ncbi:hypothetical protein TrCOL_g13498 [Triparma columacea]|uniref:Abscisic acid G-protein coupled receptor-like domain-containing protein n=1 Tax=Triparma columacea TaxID=722753 RepID=A0A9W7L1P9_9STRA|nr:hypothetical protein TrCOL_g13498 [Triparma columacea]
MLLPFILSRAARSSPKAHISSEAERSGFGVVSGAAASTSKSGDLYLLKLLPLVTSSVARKRQELNNLRGSFSHLSSILQHDLAELASLHSLVLSTARRSTRALRQGTVGLAVACLRVAFTLPTVVSPPASTSFTTTSSDGPVILLVTFLHSLGFVENYHAWVHGVSLLLTVVLIGMSLNGFLSLWTRVRIQFSGGGGRVQGGGVRGAGTLILITALVIGLYGRSVVHNLKSTLPHEYRSGMGGEDEGEGLGGGRSGGAIYLAVTGATAAVLYIQQVLTTQDLLED